ncbi:MAG: hypothetical protein ACLPPF_00050 [Rhodomicrobium sp.]
MDIINQLLKLLSQGIAAIFHLIAWVWRWTIEQIVRVHWDRLNELSTLKVILLIVAGLAVVYLLYRAGRELLEAGEKLLNAFVTLVTVLVRTLPYILIAGIVAAGTAYIINNMNF